MDISVIICTYNPVEKIFRRCLEAVAKLIRTDITAEVTIVDNNSTQPVSELAYVKSFIQSVPNSKVIVEKQQGLTFARISGFENSSGQIITFFDDDNEPESHYLVEAVKIHRARPFLGIVGPGKIIVEYVDGTDPWISAHLGGLFQQKNAQREEYILSVMNWAPCYPPGTGQVLKREVFEKYLELVRNTKLQTTDRKGSSLSSAGDSQMIWVSIANDYAVGHHPLLQVNHLIPSTRANFDYLKRLTYYLELSGRLAYVEMFPSKKAEAPVFGNSSFFYQLSKTFFNAIIRGQTKGLGVALAELLGRSEANVRIHQVAMPATLSMLKKALSIR